MLITQVRETPLVVSLYCNMLHSERYSIHQSAAVWKRELMYRNVQTVTLVLLSFPSLVNDFGFATASYLTHCSRFSKVVAVISYFVITIVSFVGKWRTFFSSQRTFPIFDPNHKFVSMQVAVNYTWIVIVPSFIIITWTLVRYIYLYTCVCAGVCVSKCIA